MALNTLQEPFQIFTKIHLKSNKRKKFRDRKFIHILFRCYWVTAYNNNYRMIFFQNTYFKVSQTDIRPSVLTLVVDTGDI
jgi:hypothetical protein